MANITYRASSTESAPASTTVKGTALTNLEMDANIKSLNDGKAENDGTGATGTWAIGISGVAATATKLATPRNINGVFFDGSANIIVSLGNTLTFKNDGSGSAADSTFDGSSAKLLSYNSIGAAPTANPTFTGTVTLPSTTSIGNVSSIEFSYLDGVTSAIQTQLDLKVTKTAQSAVVPSGATGSRDGTPSAGYFRFNTDTAKFEGYNGTTWGSVGGGATGGAGDECFIENSQTITTSYTVPTGRNAMSTGPITIDTAAVVTVSTGSNWIIL